MYEDLVKNGGNTLSSFPQLKRLTGEINKRLVERATKGPPGEASEAQKIINLINNNIESRQVVVPPQLHRRDMFDPIQHMQQKHFLLN